MLAIADVPVHNNCLIELPEDLFNPCLAADDECFARDYLRAHNGIRLDERGCKVTGPDVLGECCRDDGADGGLRMLRDQVVLHEPAVTGADHAHNHRDGHQGIRTRRQESDVLRLRNFIGTGFNHAEYFFLVRPDQYPDIE